MASKPASTMASPLLEALASRSKSHRVSCPPDCIGDYVGSINFANHCWVAQSSVREKFDSELQPAMERCLEGWTGSVASEDRINLTMYMVGINERTAAPTVLFICENVSFRKRAKQVIKESRILKQFPAFRIAYVSKDPAFGGGRLEQLASGQEPGKSNVYLEEPATQVFYDRRVPMKDIGMPIFVKHGSAMRVATANALHVDGHTLYVAPSHAFFSRQQASGLLPAKNDDDFELDSDADSVDEDDDLALITSIGSQSPDELSDDNTLYLSSDSSSSNVSYSTPTFDVSTRPGMGDGRYETEQVINKLLPFSKVEAKYPPREISIPSSHHLAPLGVLVDWSVDQDWALVEIDGGALNMLPLASETQTSFSTTALAPLPQENKRIIAYTASGGAVTGTIATTSSYTRVPRGQRFQRVFSVKLDGPLADGDCGSAVFDAVTGQLFGYIVAGCRETGFAQVMEGRAISQIEISARKLMGSGMRSLELRQTTSPNIRAVQVEYNKERLLKDDSYWAPTKAELQSWFDLPKRQMLWLGGEPGRGKTILATMPACGTNVKPKAIVQCYAPKTGKRSVIPLQPPSIETTQSTTTASQHIDIKLPTRQTTYQRPKREKLSCQLCRDNANGFRGEHELRRHMNAKHSNTVTRFVCRISATVEQTSNSQSSLQCRVCANKTQGGRYGAYYNAAAHLRRTHFGPHASHHRNMEEQGEHVRNVGENWSSSRIWPEILSVIPTEAQHDKDAASSEGDDKMGRILDKILCDCSFSCDDEAERTETEDDPVIHDDLIASENKLAKGALFRDRLWEEEDVLCFEMEAAGLANHFTRLIVRGICEYANSHKARNWRGYAVMTIDSRLTRAGILQSDVFRTLTDGFPVIVLGWPDTSGRPQGQLLLGMGLVDSSQEMRLAVVDEQSEAEQDITEEEVDEQQV